MGVLYDAIIVHSSRTLQSSLLLQSPDTVKMGTFLANSVSSTVEETLRQTSIARSGSPRNALYSLVCIIYIYIWYVHIPYMHSALFVRDVIFPHLIRKVATRGGWKLVISDAHDRAINAT